MAVGRISGPLLKANLERNGIDLAVETDLLYIDVTNNRIGINKNSPGCDLDVNGTICSDRINTDFLTVQNNYNLGNVNITSTVGDLELAPSTSSDRTKVIGDLEVTGNIIGLNFNDAFTIVDDTSTATNVELGQTLHFQSGADIDVVAGSDQINFSVTSTLDSVTGRGNTTTNDITVNDLISNGTVYTSTIDSSDSSAITVTPKMVFSSDATVENTLTVGNDVYITGNTTSAGDVTAVRFIGDGSALTGLVATYEALTDTDTTGRTTDSLNRFNGLRYVPTAMTEDASGNVTIAGQLNIGTIDTTDSSAITVVPAAVFNSDVTVENDLVANGNVTASAFFGDGSNLTGLTATYDQLTDTDTTGRTTDSLTRFDGTNYVPTAMTEDASGNITISGQVNVSTIDTADSSAITVVPSTIFNADVTVDNSIAVRNDIENISGQTILPAALGNADQVLVVDTDGLNSTWKSIGDVFDSGLYNVVEDITPQLGGNLDLNTRDITGIGSIDLTGNITASGTLFVPTIDTTDSSSITVVPAATFNSDVTVENDINLTNNLEVNNIQQTSANEETLSTTAAQTITHFDGSVFSSGKLIVQVRDNVTSEVQVCQISIIHDTVTASTTEYSNLFTGANPLASFAATIRGADVHLDATGASANSTTYKVLKTLIRFL